MLESFAADEGFQLDEDSSFSEGDDDSNLPFNSKGNQGEDSNACKTLQAVLGDAINTYSTVYDCVSEVMTEIH